MWVFRYKFHAVCATGLASEAVKAGFAQHAKEEEEHLDLLAERINQLGGKPNLNPDGVVSRATSEYAEGEVDDEDESATLAEVERRHILRILGETNWVLSGPRGAAARLGIKRTTLQSLMRRRGIVKPRAA